MIKEFLFQIVDLNICLWILKHCSRGEHYFYDTTNIQFAGKHRKAVVVAQDREDDHSRISNFFHFLGGGLSLSNHRLWQPSFLWNWSSRKLFQTHLMYCCNIGQGSPMIKGDFTLLFLLTWTFHSNGKSLSKIFDVFKCC